MALAGSRRGELGRSILLGFAVFALAVASISLTSSSGRVAVVWPVNAIVLVTLMRSATRHWWRLLLAAVIGNVAANLVSGDAILTALALSASNTIEELICATWLRAFVGRNFDVARPRHIAHFLFVAGLIGPAASGLIAGIALSVGAGAPFILTFVSTALTWFIADALGLVIVAPVGLALGQSSLSELRADLVSWRGTAVLLVVGGVLALLDHHARPLYFLLPPALVFAAFVLRPAGVVITLALAAAALVVLASSSQGALGQELGDLPHRLLHVQGVLAVTTVSALLVSSSVSARRELEARLREHARELEILHAASARLAAELDPDRLVQEITDAGCELSGAEFGAFFDNVVDQNGERYRLFALSGARREDFANFPMPHNTAIFEPTFRGDEPVRMDDVTTDPRFGLNSPFGGFPPGHLPVRSYMAVPVISRSGEVMGGLLFGHSRPGVFDEAAEHSVVALAGHAAIAIDNARLFQAAQQEIAARTAAEAQQKLLLDELNHRVKNTLATVQSISAQTLRSSTTMEAFHEAFEGRLMAISEAHNLLSRENWRGLMLEDLVRRELAPYGAEDANRISIRGPQVWLPPSTALAFGMAVHELAANAARHGALAIGSGRVALSWSVEGSGADARLKLTWEESGGPPVAPPLRRGFGTRMIDALVRQDLRGEIERRYEPSGLVCTITCPAPATETPK
jgi:two-component sensor histidine kinase/integral membrane sensor domain MASE1